MRFDYLYKTNIGGRSKIGLDISFRSLDKERKRLGYMLHYVTLICISY